jgi:membrane-bound ClpP family serine protease
MHPIVWAILLMAFGLALVVLEIFIPSGGILGCLAVAATLGAIFLAFSSGGAALGFTFVGVAAIGLPLAVMLGLKWLPKTPFGRLLLLRSLAGKDVLPENDPREKFQQLIGRIGMAKSAMLPGGAITIDRETYEAVSQSGAIDQGDPVEVVKVRNNRLVVRKSDRQPSPTDAPDDMLSRPADSVGIDPFEDPLS